MQSLDSFRSVRSFMLQRADEQLLSTQLSRAFRYIQETGFQAALRARTDMYMRIIQELQSSARTTLMLLTRPTILHVSSAREKFTSRL